MPISLLPTLLMAILLWDIHLVQLTYMHFQCLSDMENEEYLTCGWDCLLDSTAIVILALLTHLLGTVLGSYIGYVKYPRAQPTSCGWAGRYIIQVDRPRKTIEIAHSGVVSLYK